MSEYTACQHLPYGFSNGLYVDLHVSQPEMKLQDNRNNETTIKGPDNPTYES